MILSPLYLLLGITYLIQHNELVHLPYMAVAPVQISLRPVYVRGQRGSSRAFVCGLSSPVFGLHSVGRLTSGRFCRVCLRPQGAIPPGLYPLRASEAPPKGECRRGRRYFWPCRTRVGFGPATGTTVKTALCHIRALVWRIDKYLRPVYVYESEEPFPIVEVYPYSNTMFLLLTVSLL